MGSIPTSRPSRTIAAPICCAHVKNKSEKDSGGIFVGCSGWAYPSWRPDFYPAGLSPKKLLGHYAARLNSVEVNYTFRALPSAATVEAWLAQTPPGFRFSFKAPQRITHFQRLVDCGPALEALAAMLEPVALAGRLGVVLFQLPPNMRIASERLAEFLRELSPLNLQTTFEFRHPSWFDSSTYRVLEQYGAALCLAESDELETPDVVTAPFSYYRFRKSEYSSEQLAQIQDRLAERSAQGDVFAYFKHEDEPTGALRAAAVFDALRGRRK